MKKVIVFACMSLIFSLNLHATVIKKNKAVKKENKNAVSVKQNAPKAKVIVNGCETIRMPGGWWYACTVNGTCQSSWTGVNSCSNNSNGTCTTYSMVYAQP